jgi:hypothetical protein
MRLTPSAAARLYGIHRATLYRHMASGRLSWVLEADNSRALDLSELIRCYGEPPNAATPNATPATPPTSTSATATTDQLLAELVELTRSQRRELQLLREEVSQLRRLPPPSTSKEAVADSIDDDPHGLRSLARSIFDGQKRSKNRD